MGLSEAHLLTPTAPEVDPGLDEDLQLLPHTSGITETPTDTPQVSLAKPAANTEMDSQLILDAIHQQAADLNQRLLRVDGLYQQMADVLIKTLAEQGSDLSQRLSVLERQMHLVCEKIDGFNPAAIYAHLGQIESSLNSLQNRAPKPQSSSSLALSSDDETPPSPSSDCQIFVPFFVDGTLVGQANKTVLAGGTQLEMVVEILGQYPDRPLIYPFGSASNVPAFESKRFPCTFTDTNKMSGTIEGVFRRDQEGLYVIELMDIETLNEYTLPLILSGRVALTLA
jgi:hypothetical protein